MRFRVGKKFGKLSVVEAAVPRADGRSRTVCSCVCGVIKDYSTDHLKRGSIKSCGCGKGRRTNWSKHPMYRRWESVRSRCNNENHQDYPNFGGRGITMSSRWGSFGLFIKDMGECPEGYVLGRIDHDGDYCKSNCRWVTKEEQAASRRESSIPQRKKKREAEGIGRQSFRAQVPSAQRQKAKKMQFPVSVLLPILQRLDTYACEVDSFGDYRVRIGGILGIGRTEYGAAVSAECEWRKRVAK